MRFATATVIIPTARNVATATIDPRERRARPQTPWPLVQPEPSRAPKPTKRPGKRKNPKVRLEMNNRTVAETQTINQRPKNKAKQKSKISQLIIAGGPETAADYRAHPSDASVPATSRLRTLLKKWLSKCCEERQAGCRQARPSLADPFPR
jgi:hypothetical protein